LRNAAIVLGNAKDLYAQQDLIVAIDDAEPLIRGAAAWALGQLQTQPALLALQSRRAVELDESVRIEIHAALAEDNSTDASSHP
jgi:epoxyqueuosine reductase